MRPSSVTGSRLRVSLCQLAPVLHLPAEFFLDLGGALRLAFVVQLLAAGDGKLDLGLAILEVHSQRDKRETLLRRLAGELVNLTAMHQQFAWTLGLVIEDIAHG